MNMETKVIIIGGGPAGLTAAYELSKVGMQASVLEKDTIVGGISRTEQYNGFYFDIGGHRFFTKVAAVRQFWHDVLPDGEFLRCARLSRIYYNKKFFYYPLRPINALFGLGIWNSILIFLSYLWAHTFPELPEDNFERWVTNRFGKRLYRIFFKTYTEKVWGMPANEIAAEWVAQRIKGLSLLVALKNALVKEPANKKNVVTTLIDSFEYPKFGPGMMWETVAELVKKRGHAIHMGTDVEKITWSKTKVLSVHGNKQTHVAEFTGTHFVSSMPIRELIQKLDPPVPDKVLEAANQLKYRDFLTVALMVNKKELFPDNWIYIHDPDVQVGRIQNFKNWSPHMVPDALKTCLGLEYFCFEGDGLWTMADEQLIELAKKEISALGFAHPHEVEDGRVVRMPKAYPVYDGTYRAALQTVRGFLDTLDNLQVVGRNGMHKYNNQDHSMLTAMLAVENILGSHHNLWDVNADQEYHEEITSEAGQRRKELAILESTQPTVPIPVPALSSAETSLVQTFSRMDKLGFATALGAVSGFAIFMATLWLVVKGGATVGPHLQLLGQYFFGYTVSISGAFIGAVYCFVWGFLWGWLFAYIRNFILGYAVYRIKKEMELLSFTDFLDHY